MSIIGHLIAICILLMVGVVYFQNKYYLTPSSKHFAASIVLTTLYCFVSIALYETVRFDTVNPIVMHILGFFEALLVAVTSTIAALYVILKLTEHTCQGKCYTRARKVFLSFLTVYVTLLVTNIPVGWIFSIDSAGRYIPGPLAHIEYYLITLQVIMVVYCAILNRKTVSKSARLASWQSLFTALICGGLRNIYPEISFLPLAISFLLAVFFINFQSHRIGVNTLTMLNDKRRFFAELDDRLALKNTFNVFLVRIENYDVLNSIYGHHVGDEVLYLFAFGLENLFPEGVAFHIHSTTFAIVLPDNDKEEKYATRLIKYAEAPVRFENYTIKLKYRVVGRTCQGDIDSATFYEQLTYALHQVRKSDSNYLDYTPDMSVDMFREKHLISRLQQIDSAHGFEVWYQPIYSTGKKKFSAMEALIRLREPNGSFISPGEFIPIAERTGLIVPITRFVIDQVCRMLRDHPELGNVRASVNLSISNLVDDGFVQRLNEIVDSYGIAHERLSFEFTERVIIEKLAAAKANMKKLTESGYTFYLDDFGVGYSNFNCVLQLPIRTVKLDMSLTSASAISNDNYGLVKILTDLFHDMGLRVVAEGAETDEQVSILTEYGVDGIQGYYYARPMPISKLLDFLKKNGQI